MFRVLPCVSFVPALYFCIASCHHASSHKYFATQLNKWHGSLIHLNRGNSHGDSLYNISSRYLESYSNYSIYLELTITHLHNNSVPFLLQVGSPNSALNSFFTFRSSTKNLNIFGHFQNQVLVQTHLN